MDVKQAVQIALTYVGDLFSGEDLINLGLEEVTFDEAHSVWEVTVGFSRRWDFPRSHPLIPLAEAVPRRQYKVVRVDDADGRVESVKIREPK